jgi:hypothetical protein
LRRAIGRVDRVDVPLRDEGWDAVPAHQICECVMVDQKRGVVAAGVQPGGLCVRPGVEEADGDGVDVGCRWCRDDLNGSNRVTRGEEMPTLTLKLNRTLHRQLGRLLPPLKALGLWIGGEIPQFRTLDLGSQLRFEQFAHCCLSDTARAGHEQEHA